MEEEEDEEEEGRKTYREAAMAHKCEDRFQLKCLEEHLRSQSFYEGNGKPALHHLDKT